jgi:hypothetical protein
MKPYSDEIEQQMSRFYQSLTEKEQRRYAALEACKLGHGGKTYIRELLGCDYKTQARGLRDLQDEASMTQPGIRQQGGGRKKNRRHSART